MHGGRLINGIKIFNQFSVAKVERGTASEAVDGHNAAYTTKPSNGKNREEGRN